MPIGKSGSQAMQGYRAYIIGSDGHVVGRMDLFCSNDDDAKERAEKLVDGHAVELWDGARKIARFEPDHRPQ